jgi:mannosyltransferase
MPSVVTEEAYGTDVAATCSRGTLVGRLAARTLDAPQPPPAPRPVDAVPRRRRPDWTLVAGPAVTLAVMLWGVGARPYWGDEADTVSAVSRSVPQLVRLLGHIDAVHGLYYLLLWPVARVAGTGELVTRLPSAVAMAAAAAGVTAIARRLASRRAGLCAGLVFAVLPTVTREGHDARPYAAVTAAAVLASYLLVAAAQDPRPRRLAGYGLSVVLVGYLQLFGLLLVPAHAAALIGLGRRHRAAGEARPRGAPRIRPARGWLVTVTAIAVAVAPVTVLGWAQRGQIAWIPAPGWHDAGDLTGTLIAGSAAAAAVIGLLCVLGAIRAPAGGPAVGGSPRRGLTWLAVPWLLLPPLILLVASEVRPVFFTRYVTFCLPAVALLAGAGLAALRWPARAAVVALVVALVAPAHLALRAPGGGMQMVAQFLRAHERPGDAIVYPEASIPPWYLAYPDGFARLRDIGLAQTPAAAGRLFAPSVSPAVLKRREQGVRRIWIVPIRGSHNPAGYLAPGFRLAREWKVHGYQVVLLYTKAP